MITKSFRITFRSSGWRLANRPPPLKWLAKTAPTGLGFCNLGVQLTCKPVLAHALAMKGKRRLAQPGDDVYRALADPTRRAILDELVERDGQTLFELCTHLTMKHGIGSTRQAISQHLAVLEAAGLVGPRCATPQTERVMPPSTRMFCPVR